MRFLLEVIRAYPSRSLLTVLTLLVAGVVQGLSLSALLPLLSIAVDPQGGGEAPAGMGFSDFLRDLGINPSIGMLLTLIVIGMFLKAVLVLYANRHVGYTVAQITTDLRFRLLRALVNARWDYFLNQPSGRLTNAMATEPKRAGAAFLNAFRILSQSIQTAVYVAVAFTVSWEATLAALVAGGTVTLGFGRFVRVARRAGRRKTKRMVSLVVVMTDVLSSIKPLKAMGLVDRSNAVLESETKGLNRALRLEVFSKEALNALYEPFIVAILAIGLYFAFTLLELAMSHLLVLVVVLLRALGSIGKTQRTHQNLVTAESAYWSLLDSIERAEHQREAVGGTTQPSLVREIRLDNIRISFGPNEVLRGLNLTLPAGTFTTLVGTSGAGKTTVIDIITGLIKPTEGEVLVDGVPLQHCDLSEWRRMIGYVPQDILLFNDTVLHNVTLGDPGLDEAAAESALRAAEAWTFVADMPEGLHSIVGERGGKLSGGQRQRLCIARALARRPQLLILDEATSALDPESAGAVIHTLAGLRGQLTILAISHQSELAAIAERVWRVQDGILLPVNSEDSGIAVASKLGSRQSVDR